MLSYTEIRNIVLLFTVGKNNISICNICPGYVAASLTNPNFLGIVALPILHISHGPYNIEATRKSRDVRSQLMIPLLSNKLPNTLSLGCDYLLCSDLACSARFRCNKVYC